MIAKKYERKGNFQIRLDSLKTDMESLDDLLTPNIALQNLFSNQTFILVGMVDLLPNYMLYRICLATKHLFW